jgi:DNA-binding helix-hairpin-helix protein with protein kinase domain
VLARPRPIRLPLQKQKHDGEQRRSAHKEEKDKILLAIEDDKKMRAMVQEVTKQQAAAAAGAPGAGAGAGAASPAGGGEAGAQ